MILLIILTVLDEKENILKKGFTYILGAYLAFFFFSLGFFSWFTHSRIGYFFYKVVAVAAIVYAIVRIREFFGQPTQWFPKGQLKALLSYVSVFVIGFIASFFTFSSANTSLLSLRILMGDEVTRWMAWPLVLYYSFIFVIMMIIALLIVYLIRCELNLRAKHQGKEKKIDAWKKHYLKILNLIVNGITLLIGLILLFV